MKATDTLMHEHRVIEHVLDALEIAAARLDRGGDVRPGFFLDAADFITGFADGCHHRKEEGVFFTAMRDAGAPRDGPPIDTMLEEHREARALTAALRDGAHRLEGGDRSASAAVASAARKYVVLLRDHIEKEDGMLFPMADELFTPERDAAVAEAFEDVERAETGEGEHERFHTLAHQLADEARALRP